MAKLRVNDEDPGALGYITLLFLVAFFVFIAWGIYALYAERWGPRPVVISLAAYFVNEPATPRALGDAAASAGSYLKVAGQAYQGGKPLQAGTVRLTVSKQDFSQSVLVDLTKGKFETADNNRLFSSLKPSDPIHIAAEVSSSERSQKATDELYLNAAPPIMTPFRKSLLWLAIAALIGIFFYSFTGPKTRGKNRVAIMFSYLIIGVFLAVPLLSPVLLLHAYPSAQRNMIGKPAGVVVTIVGNPQEVCTQQQRQRQWALNIGGYSFEGDPCTERTSATAAKAARGSAGNASTTDTTSTAGTGSTTGTASATTGAIGTAGTTNTAVGTTDDTGTSGTRGTNVPQQTAVLPIPGDPNQPVVATGEGGLVIPLYVIVLSMIGGAINMTRKVPRYQREGEHSEMIVPGAGQLKQKAITAASNLTSEILRARPSSPRHPEGADPAVEQAKSASGQNASGATGDGATNAGKKTDENGVVAQKIETIQPIPAAEVKDKETPTDMAELSLEEQAKILDGQIDALVKEQVTRNCEADATLGTIRKLVQQMRAVFDNRRPDEPPLLKLDSFEDWLGTHASLRELLGSNWRVELLNQYMYLISAPFLAIVAYYMLDLLGLTKQPVVVVLSFSVGLISERIVSWILGVAGGYLRTETSVQSGVKTESTS